MIAHCASVNVIRIKSTSHLVTLNHSATDLGILKRQQALAGLAFSQTKTAIAHSLSYPITLGWGLQHGIACSFSLPIILRSVQGIGGAREEALAGIFGDDFSQGALWLMGFLNRIGIGCTFSALGVPKRQVIPIVEAAFEGPRGLNFAGNKARFMESLKFQDSLGSQIT